MYLTDRYCLRKYNYIFFGTQNGGNDTISVPVQFDDLLQNPLKFLELIENPVSPENQTKPDNAEMLALWQTAKKYTDRVYEDRPRTNQDDVIKEFIQKFSAQ
jgi:hypothetical protein